MKNSEKNIKQIIKTEIEKLPELIEKMAAKDRASYLIQLMKYEDSKDEKADFSFGL